MKLEQLHTVKDFTSLFSDERFVMLVLYLRSQRPHIGSGDAHHVISDGGRVEGWLECIEKMEAAAVPPGSLQQLTRPIPYAKSHPENNS